MKYQQIGLLKQQESQVAMGQAVWHQCAGLMMDCGVIASVAVLAFQA